MEGRALTEARGRCCEKSRAPFVLPEKRRRVRGGPRGLKDGPPQLDLGGTLDSAETSGRCKVPSVFPSLRLAAALVHVFPPLLGSAGSAGRHQRPR